MKTLITSAPALRPIDYHSDSPVVLSVDTSYIAVGFILSQYDEQGRKHPARFGSLPLNEREARYSQPKLELYGLYRALRHFRLYLINVKNLYVEVDAKYIKGMLNEPDLQPNNAINRWIQGILLFTFKLIHVPATQFKGPDALSRRIPAIDEYEDFSEEFLDEIVLSARCLPQSQTNNRGRLQSQVWGRAGRQEDISKNYAGSVFQVRKLNPEQKLLAIQHFLQTLQTPEFSEVDETIKARMRSRFVRIAQQYYLKDQLMFKRGQNNPQRVILDRSEREKILELAHEELGHRGVYATLELLKKRFYWPVMFEHVKQHIKSCHQCQVHSTRKVTLPLIPSTPAALFIKLHVDVMYMPKAHGCRYIVAARDDLSRASEGRALKTCSATELAAFFWEQILCRYGTIGCVITDNGPEVKGAFQNLMRRYGIPQIKIMPYNSRGNGVVERGHFIIRESIKTVSGSHPA